MSVRVFLAVAVLSSPVAAQTVTFTGVVQPVPGPTICQQGETHLLECVPVYLKSASVNLNAFVGQTVRLTGQDVGLLCTVIEVSAAVVAPVTLAWTGAPTPGGTVNVSVCINDANPPHSFVLFISSSSGFLPLGPVFGTALLGFPVYFLGSGFAAPCGNFPVVIPADPSLVGATVYEQAFGSGTFVQQLSNATCLTIV